MDGFSAHQSAWHLGQRLHVRARTCVYMHVRAHTCVHVSVARETLPSAVRSSRTSSESSRQGFQKRRLICQEGGLLSLGAAGCRWSDIKFCSASHLVAALAGWKNSPWTSCGLWTSHSGLTRPLGDPQTGLCSANQQGPPFQPSVAGFALNTESAPSRGEQSTESDIRSTGDCVLAPPDILLDLSEPPFPLSRPSVPGPSEDGIGDNTVHSVSQPWHCWCTGLDNSL